MFVFSFAEHPYSRIAVLGFTLVGALALLYGLQGTKASEQIISLWAIASAIGIAFANDFITLFFFWELLTITTSILILLNCFNSDRAFFMGTRFLVLHLLGGLLVFFGILRHYAATGSLMLTQPEAGLTFFIIGFGIKAAFIPLHLWVAWGYPSASLFSSVVLAGLTTKIGVYAIARILPPNDFIVLMGASMALMGVICALMQKNMRQLLSYHIISQVGFMVAGVGLGLSLSVDGGLLHLVNHMLYKALLFMSAGVVLYSSGTENVHDLTHHDEKSNANQGPLQPVWRSLPIATIGAFVGALAISGVPPFNGYVSKYLLKNAFYGVEPAETMLLIASIGTVASFSKFIYFGFLKARARNFKRPTIAMHIAIIAGSFLCILLGVRPQLIAPILPYGSSLAVYSAGGIQTALLLLAIGILVFAILSKPLHKGIPLPQWFSIEYLMFLPLRLAFRIVTISGKSIDNSVNNLAFDSSNSLKEKGQTEKRKEVLNPSQWSIKNLNFDQFLMGILLAIILFILFYYSGGFRGSF